ncbi:MAG: biopolymer transporter ExbD [Nitrospirae bacterium]|nr:biopolymer transporter ExbD [Nitrospirota bacterium]
MLPRPSSRKHRMASEKDLQIIAFLNLMVILIPFLLMTAVFAKMAVIDMEAPQVSSQESGPQNSGVKDQKKLFRLTIAILENEINVLDGETLLGIFRKDTAGNYDYSGLSALITQLKSRYPGENDLSILSRPDTPYMILVETIDAARGQFPGISLNEL